MNSITGGRVEALEHSRALKMARSTHAYVRGNTTKFYEWLAESPTARRLPKGPAIWICGNCHLGNLGPVAAADEKVEDPARISDMTGPAPPFVRDAGKNSARWVSGSE